MKLKIKEQEIELKYSFRAMLIYEKITDKSFIPQSLYDVVMFFYASILAAAKDLVINFDEFLDFIDENPSLVTEFSEWLTESIEHQARIQNKKPEPDEEKKSKKKSKKTQITG